MTDQAVTNIIDNELAHWFCTCGVFNYAKWKQSDTKGWYRRSVHAADSRWEVIEDEQVPAQVLAMYALR